MLGNVSTPRSRGWGTMAAVVCSFPISDAMVSCSTRKSTYVSYWECLRGTKTARERFLPLVAGWKPVCPLREGTVKNVPYATILLPRSFWPLCSTTHITFLAHHGSRRHQPKPSPTPTDWIRVLVALSPSDYAVHGWGSNPPCGGVPLWTHNMKNMFWTFLGAPPWYVGNEQIDPPW